MMFAYVAIGGGLGALARFLLANLWNGKGKLPYGTWIANITGSLFLALFILLRAKGLLSEAIWQLAGIGFCGSFTTFSTFGKETVNLIFEQKPKEAFIYVSSSLLMSLLIVGVILIPFL